MVTAPVNGTVVNLKFKTEGGVIQHGEPILDIVPSDEPLLIDARVLPTDIDVVHVGLPAVIHLTAFTSRNLPRIEGKVEYVSADRLVDEKSGQSYYLARVAVDRGELDRLGPQYKLVPGMPAEVLIVTGERTMFQYLFQPFLDFDSAQLPRSMKRRRSLIYESKPDNGTSVSGSAYWLASATCLLPSEVRPRLPRRRSGVLALIAPKLL